MCWGNKSEFMKRTTLLAVSLLIMVMLTGRPVMACYFGNDPRSRHSTGNGWIAASAHAATTAYSREKSVVCHNAQVIDNAVIRGISSVTHNGSVSGNAVV